MGLFDVAVKAASLGGLVLRQEFRRPGLPVEKKGEIDLVTLADRRAESAIVECIAQDYPEHRIIAEEGGSRGGLREDEPLWLVDPLDGTVNFAHGYPCFCVSVALREGVSTVLGVVLEPIRGIWFWAEAGQPAWRAHLRADHWSRETSGAEITAELIAHSEPMRVSGGERLAGSLIGTGFPYRLREKPAQLVYRFARVLLGSRAVRRDGSAALDLCQVANGVFDGYWEQDLFPWDVAAGALIVERAGGLVTDFCGEAFDPFGAEILASNGTIHRELSALLVGDPEWERIDRMVGPP
ncbi:MAG: inositol monophosphatase [Candidatus Schekmanbacteria bacterium]|nr:inositol monophosphatase [Candidatus Schekmanbacteria bacterium]